MTRITPLGTIYSKSSASNRTAPMVSKFTVSNSILGDSMLGPDRERCDSGIQATMISSSPAPDDLPASPHTSALSRVFAIIGVSIWSWAWSLNAARAYQLFLTVAMNCGPSSVCSTLDKSGHGRIALGEETIEDSEMSCTEPVCMTQQGGR